MAATLPYLTTRVPGEVIAAAHHNGLLSNDTTLRDALADASGIDNDSILPEKLKNTAIPAADANGWITRTLGNVHISTQNFSYPNSQKVNGEPVPDTPTLNFSNPVGCNLNASTTSFMQPKIINAPNSSDKLVSALRTTSSTSGQLILKLLTNETGVVNISGGDITLGIIW